MSQPRIVTVVTKQPECILEAMELISIIIEEDEVVIYDESDDYDPGEDEVNSNEDTESGEFRLFTNEEIFTDEYMQEYAKKMDAQMAKETRIQRLISVGVVVAVILFIALVAFINFKDLI